MVVHQKGGGFWHSFVVIVMEETKDDVCEKLDRVLLEFFETLTHLYQKQALFDESMKSGLLNMSRARYNMGIKAVGIAQCDKNNMSALLRVKITKDKHKDNTFMAESSNDLETDLDELDLKKSDDSLRSTVRRRNVNKAPENTEQEHIEDIPQQGDNSSDNSYDSKKSKRENNIPRKSDDPLKWFGVLVPQSLRHSQCDFKAAAEMALDLATLKTKLDNIGQEYRSLLKLKETLVK